MENAVKAKSNMNDSVFTNLFKEKEYTVQLYKVLHPEDTEVTEDSIKIVTLENILLNQPYNDLGFMVRDRLVILVEAQSTWSVNIVVRGLLYMAQTIQTHIADTRQNIYSSRKVEFPEPEFYVLYTGDRQDRPTELKLSEEFFDGRVGALEVNVKVLYDGKDGDIIHQYVAFTKIYHEQVKRYGRTHRAVLETIQICKDRNVLKRYLESREKEVVDIMMTLFNREQILDAYVEEQKREAAKAAAEKATKAAEEKAEKAVKAATEKAAKASAFKMQARGMDVAEIADLVGYSLELVKKWLGVMPA